MTALSVRRPSPSQGAGMLTTVSPPLPSPAQEHRSLPPGVGARLGMHSAGRVSQRVGTGLRGAGGGRGSGAGPMPGEMPGVPCVRPFPSQCHWPLRWRL